MATMDNLKEAFAGESQANRKYLAFAKKADEEGHPQVARLFRAAAEAETVHAHGHLGVMKGVKGTDENLQAAVDGEGFEFKDMYPGFIKEAEQEGNKEAVRAFKHARAVEGIHQGLYADALKAIKAGTEPDDAPIFVCGICGNTVPGCAPEKCPICGAPQAKFTEVK